MANQPTGIQNLTSLLSLYKPAGGSTSTVSNGGSITETVSETLSPEAHDAIIRSIMEGPNGLGAIAGQQKTAGLYNSSTNSLLQNDLAGRVAGELAKAQKTTSRTVQDNSTKTQVNTPTPQMTMGGTAKGLAALKALQFAAPLAKVGAKKFGIDGVDKLGEKAASTIFGDSSTGSSIGAVSDAVSGSAGDFIPDDWMSNLDSTTFSDFSSEAAASFGTDIGIDLGTDLAASLGTSVGSELAAGLGESAVDFIPDDWMTDIGSSIGDFFSFANGGRVPARKQAQQPKRHFADGGKVQRGRVNPNSSYSDEVMSPRKVTVNRALEGQATPGTSVASTGMTEAQMLAMRQQAINDYRTKMQEGEARRQEIRDMNVAGGEAVGANSPNDGHSGFGNPSSALGAFGALAGAIAIGAPVGALSVANAAMSAQTGQGVVSNALSAIANALGLGNTAQSDSLGNTFGQMGDAAEGVGGDGGLSGSGNSPGDGGGFGAGSGMGAEGGVSGTGDGGDGLGGTVGSGNMGGDGIGGVGDGGFGGNGEGVGSVGGDGGFGGSGGEGGNGGEGGGGEGGNGGGEGGGFKNGGSPAGKLPGHDLKGKDDIQINVSGGEFIIPTDVVDILGEEFFDNIINKLHKPIGGK